MSAFTISALSHGLILGAYFPPIAATAADIKRVTELYLCQALSAAIPTHNFQPFSGGTSTEDEEELEPPFTVIAVTVAERAMAQEGTWQCKGTAQVITYSSETSTPDHALLVRSIYAVLADLSPDSSDPSFSFHGIDITGQSVTQDDGLKAHADVIQFQVGVGG